MAREGLLPRDCTHAGLALSRLIQVGVTDALDPVAGIRPSGDYSSAYERWADLTNALPGTVQAIATARTEVAVGMGNFSPAENGLTLHHSWGVPYLPGSALKGVARRAGSDHGVSEAEAEVLFGSVETQGYVHFNDAWLVPSVNKDRPMLALDVMTPHAGGYYSSQGAKAPDDFEDPNPIKFLVVPRGTRFLVSLDCPEDGEWAEVALTLLTYGLRYLGLGSKTNAGYGTFAVERR